MSTSTWTPAQTATALRRSLATRPRHPPRGGHRQSPVATTSKGSVNRSFLFE